MSTHSLQASSLVVEGLKRLGEALGYVVIPELQVESGRANAPAVDVAWLTEVAHRFPLMIFEIESKATNSASNNPVKVFSQSSDEFEKPLFFFHVFLRTGQKSTRVSNLRRLFGSHNYRVYSLDRDGLEPLLRDILEQHRRLQRSVQLTKLLDEVSKPPWDQVDPAVVSGIVERLHFKATFLASYATRAQTDSRYRIEHLRLLRDSESPYGPEGQAEGYQSYIGRAWVPPIHLGLLALATAETKWLHRLSDWQEGWTHMSMIGPHFGLSRDYDEFVLGLSPVLWALTAALMYKIPDAGAYIGAQLMTVLENIRYAQPEVSIFTALWTLHVSSAIGHDESYRFAQGIINAGGGVGPSLLYEPPSTAGIFERDGVDEHVLAAEREPVPEVSEFRRQLPPHYNRVSNLDEELFRFVYELLANNEALFTWSGPVALFLHTAYGRLPVLAATE